MKKLSVAEVMLLKEIEKAGLPAPVKNYKYKPTGFRLRLAWPDKKVAASLKTEIWKMEQSGTLTRLKKDGWEGQFFCEMSITHAIKRLRILLERGQ